MKPRFIEIVALVVLGAGSAFAGPAVSKEVIVPIEEPKTFCDMYGDLLGLATLYESDTNPILQELKLIGRYNGQYIATESDLGDNSDWENRRFRFGVAADLFNQFEFEGQFNLKRDFSTSGRLFRFVDTLFVTWAPPVLENFLGGTEITVGKQKPAITQEYGTSSKRILTMERSNIVNNVVPLKAGGVVLSFADVAGFEVDLGGFAGGLETDWLLPDGGGGYGIYSRIGRSLTDATDVRFDYFYNDGDDGSLAFSRFENVFSLNSTSSWDGWGLNTDLIYGDDHSGGSGDVYGLVVMPWYDLTDKLKAVFRYTYSGSDGETGLTETRVERLAGGRLTGDEYHGFYGGLNYYLCGEKLKLYNGVEWSSFSGPEDNEYWSFMSGIRMYF